MNAHRREGEERRCPQRQSLPAGSRLAGLLHCSMCQRTGQEGADSSVWTEEVGLEPEGGGDSAPKGVRDSSQTSPKSLSFGPVFRSCKGRSRPVLPLLKSSRSSRPRGPCSLTGAQMRLHTSTDTASLSHTRAHTQTHTSVPLEPGLRKVEECGGKNPKGQHLQHKDSVLDQWSSWGCAPVPFLR